MLWITGHDNNGNEFEIVDGEAIWAMEMGPTIFLAVAICLVIAIISSITGIGFDSVAGSLFLVGVPCALLIIFGKDAINNVFRSPEYWVSELFCIVVITWRYYSK